MSISTKYTNKNSRAVLTAAVARSLAPGRQPGVLFLVSHVGVVSEGQVALAVPIPRAHLAVQNHLGAGACR